jgi:hypothetical protein
MMANQHDDAVEKVLAALKTAAPPEGMDARIEERLRQHAQTAATAPTWRNRIAASLPTAAWGRGALTGAAMATLAIAAVLFLQRATQVPPKPNQPIAVTPSSAPITAMPVSRSADAPCPSPRILRAHAPAPVLEVPPPSTVTLRAENRAPSRPAPAMPLTAQERQLARLVHTADPRQLATLNPETQARLEAEDAAEFEKFFTPPPPPKPIEHNE